MSAAADQLIVAALCWRLKRSLEQLRKKSDAGYSTITQKTSVSLQRYQ
jgi:hypothetical protein